METQVVATNSQAKIVHLRGSITTVCGATTFRKANAVQLETAKRCARCFPEAAAAAPKTTSRKPAAPKAASLPQQPAPVAEAAPAEDRWVYRLSYAQLEASREKFTKINDRAAKKGLTGSWGFTSVERRVETQTHPATGFPVERVYYECTIGGSAPAFEGWQFIGTLDWDEYAGLIVRALPGAPAIQRDNLRQGWCDHCKTTRIRRTTYVVRDTSNGAQLQVGGSCIKDFTGWAGNVAWLEKQLPSQSGEEWFGQAGHVDYTPSAVLATAWAVIKQHGFVPASHHDKTTTRTLVDMALYPNTKNAKEEAFARSLRPLAKEAAGRAEEIKAFVLSDAFGGDSDYVLNLKAAAAGERVSPRNFGLLVSAPQAYARHLERTLIREKQAADDAGSQWIGTAPDKAQGVKGSRLEVEVTMRSLRYIQGDYGVSTLYVMTDGSGNVLKWFASDDKLGEREGARFLIRGTVKAHEEYHGVRQTVLTRCTVLKTLPTE